METTIKQRIIEFVESEGISISAFEKRCGMANGYLRQLRKAPSIDKIERIISAFPKLNRDWLVSGEGEMLQPEKTTISEDALKEWVRSVLASPLSEEDARKALYIEEVRKAGLDSIINNGIERRPKRKATTTDSHLPAGVPYYDEDFECGFDELTPPFSEQPECLVYVPGYERATLWCNASGDSMEPEISNGDMIALKLIEDPSFLPYGDIYAIITTNDMRTIKRLGKSSEKGCYRLIPTNKEYDAQDLPINMILRVYRVMGAMKAF